MFPNKYEIWGSYRGVVDDLNLLGCYDMLPRKYLTTVFEGS